MRTRTLLLLAVGCGLLILVAGVAQLVRISGQDDPPRPVEVGTPVAVGDLTVTVERLDEADGQATVVIETGGVDDADGAGEFRLIVAGTPLQATGGTDAAVPPCVGTTVDVQRCSLTFDVGAVDGTSRVLLYRRGDEQVRWDLAAG